MKSAKNSERFLDFKKQLGKFKKEIDKELVLFFEEKVFLPKDKEYKYFVDVLREYTLRKTSKRIRGSLCFATYRMYGGRKRFVFDVAVALELMHSFLLIHDDWIDGDKTRRGGLTVHKTFEHKFKKQKNYEHTASSSAVILGDFASFLSQKAILDSAMPDRLKTALLKAININLLKTAYGEYLDIINSSKRNHIEKMIEYKTSYYTFVNPLIAGALCAGASKAEVEKLEEIGKSLGKAFQIYDDILDLFSNKTGKDVASDIRQGKYNFLILRALDSLKGSELQRFRKIFSGKERLNSKNIRFVKSAIETSGALEYNINKALSYREEAVQKISKLKVKNKKYLYFLYQLSDYIVNRDV